MIRKLLEIFQASCHDDFHQGGLGRSVIHFYVDFKSSITIISDHLDVRSGAEESKMIPRYKIYLFNPHPLGKKWVKMYTNLGDRKNGFATMADCKLEGAVTSNSLYIVARRKF